MHPHAVWPPEQMARHWPLTQDCPQPHGGVQLCTWQAPSWQISPGPHMPMLQTPPQPSGLPQLPLCGHMGMQHWLVLGLHSSPISGHTSQARPQLSGELQLEAEQVEVQHIPVSMLHSSPAPQLLQVEPQPSSSPHIPEGQLGVQHPMPPSEKEMHSPPPAHCPPQDPPQPSGEPQASLAQFG